MQIHIPVVTKSFLTLDNDQVRQVVQEFIRLQFKLPSWLDKYSVSDGNLIHTERYYNHNKSDYDYKPTIIREATEMEQAVYTIMMKTDEFMNLRWEEALRNTHYRRE